jgi:hypothetical protein
MAHLGVNAGAARTIPAYPAPSDRAVHRPTRLGKRQDSSGAIRPPEAFHDLAPSWEPVFWELAEHSTEELLSSHETFVQSMTILKADAIEFAEAEQLFTRVFRQIDPLHESRRVRWQDLLKFLLGWAHNRRPGNERARWHDLTLGLHTDADRRREIDRMGTTIAQSLIEEGRQEGRQEGRAEGALTHARRTIVRLGRRRLSAPDETTLAAINSLSDLDRLDRMTERLDEVQSWEELLRTE